VTSRGQDIVSVIKQQIEQFGAELTMVDVGTVLEIGDGIARIYGLAAAKYNELLEFPNEVMGIALNLEEDSVAAVVLGDYTGIKEGDEVKCTGRIAEIPVGDALIGRVVDSLGKPLDGKGPVKTDKTRPLERVAPNVTKRQSVDTPVQTGIKAVDSMFPIGRGQRELIIGDRSTGKTAIALDAIIHQGSPGGQHAGELRSHGACHRGGGQRRRCRCHAVPGPLRWLCHRRGVHGGGQRRFDCLRRPLQARLVLPPAFPALAPSPGAGSLSR